MAQQTIQSIRGVEDKGDQKLLVWRTLETILERCAESFGYEEIRTPILEPVGLFLDTVGHESELVQKQLFLTGATDEERYVLRPEGTAPVVRALLQHQWPKRAGLYRYYYLGPMFRYERPQKGRLRQFHQFGVELLGSKSPSLDASVIAFFHTLLKQLSLSNFEIHLNSVGCSQCKPVQHSTLRSYFQPFLGALCESCKKKYERAPVRILDCKRESCSHIAAGAPPNALWLCADCRAFHDEVRLHLEWLQVPFQDNFRIVRGLDYYEKTAFEVLSPELGAQSAIGGGGRYDGLAARIGTTHPLPGMGFALGMERLALLFQNARVLSPKTPFCYFCALDTEAVKPLYVLAHHLQASGFWVVPPSGTVSLADGLRLANRCQADFALILGSTELESKTALLKDMETGEQESLAWNSISEELMKKGALSGAKT